MSTIIPEIQVTDRDKSVNPRMLRREGRLPATVYGGRVDSVSIDLDKKNFTYLYYSQFLNLVTLNKGNNKLRALVKNVHIDPISAELLNVEFMRVSDDEKLTLSVPILLEGEAPAFKKAATMLQLMDEVEVECLPQNIPSILIVDMTAVVDVDTTITVADIKYPEGVFTTLPPDTPVLRVSPPRGTAADSEEDQGGDSASSTQTTEKA